MAKLEAPPAAAGARPKTAIPGAPRGTTFYIHPKKLIILRDKKHRLYDRREEKKLSVAYLEVMREYGILESVLVMKDGKDPDGEDRLIVVDGRQRVAGALAITEENEKSNLPPLLVPCTLKRLDDRGFFATMIIANEHRSDDDMMFRAEKAAKFMDVFGATLEQAAAAFNTTARTITTWIRVWGLSDPVKAKIAELGIPPANVERLSDFPRDEQMGYLEQLIAAGNTSKAQVTSALRLSGVTTPAVSAPDDEAREEAKRKHDNREKRKERPKKLIDYKVNIVPVKRVRALLKAVREDASLNVPQEYITALSWVAGEISDEKLAKKMGLKALPG